MSTNSPNDVARGATQRRSADFMLLRCEADAFVDFPPPKPSIARWGRTTQWRGDYPRSFAVDPTGRFLFSCNQRSDAIASFRIDAKTGRLTFTGHYTPIGLPAHIVFLG